MITNLDAVGLMRLYRDTYGQSIGRNAMQSTVANTPPACLASYKQQQTLQGFGCTANSRSSQLTACMILVIIITPILSFLTISLNYDIAQTPYQVQSVLCRI
jgi:hypothetical protein